MEITDVTYFYFYFLFVSVRASLHTPRLISWDIRLTLILLVDKETYKILILDRWSSRIELIPSKHKLQRLIKMVLLALAQSRVVESRLQLFLSWFRLITHPFCTKASFSCFCCNLVKPFTAFSFCFTFSLLVEFVSFEHWEWERETNEDMLSWGLREITC